MKQKESYKFSLEIRTRYSPYIYSLLIVVVTNCNPPYYLLINKTKPIIHHSVII